MIIANTQKSPISIEGALMSWYTKPIISNIATNRSNPIWLYCLLSF